MQTIESNLKHWKNPKTIKNSFWTTWNNLNQIEGQKEPQTTVHKIEQTNTSQEQLQTT